MKLEKRTYKYQELKALKKEILETRKNDIDFLIEHITALRIFGWKLILPQTIPRDVINGFYDVITIDKSLHKDQAILYTGDR